MMDQDHAEVMAVCDGLEGSHVAVVTGIHTALVHRAIPHLLQGVNDDQSGLGIVPQKILQLLLQAAAQPLTQHRKAEGFRCFLRQLLQTALNPCVSILQTQVKHVAAMGGKFPQGFSPGHLQC